jgi:hypothetical protein
VGVGIASFSEDSLRRVGRCSHPWVCCQRESRAYANGRRRRRTPMCNAATLSRDRRAGAIAGARLRVQGPHRGTPRERDRRVRVVLSYMLGSVDPGSYPRPPARNTRLLPRVHQDGRGERCRAIVSSKTSTSYGLVTHSSAPSLVAALAPLLAVSRMTGNRGAYPCCGLPPGRQRDPGLR